MNQRRGKRSEPEGQQDDAVWRADRNRQGSGDEATSYRGICLPLERRDQRRGSNREPGDDDGGRGLLQRRACQMNSTFDTT